MTCTCQETRELDEFGQTYEGDFVEDFEAMLDELDQEGDQETGASRRKKYGDLELDELDQESDQEAEIIGPDNRKRVPDTTKAPFRYICNLEYKIPGIGYRAIGSGTLIGPRTVLTAGHCLVDENDKPLVKQLMRVRPGRNGARSLAAATPVHFEFFPRFAPGTRTDVGIIHLAQPVGKSIGSWTRVYAKRPGDPIGTSFIRGDLPVDPGKLKVNLSGYPGDMPGDPRLRCRESPAVPCAYSSPDDPKRNPLCGTYQYRAYDLTVRLAGGILHYLNDTCPGHSGCPVWVRRSPDRGGRVLVAVHISGDDPKIAGKANRAVFLDAKVRQWIAKFTK
ncbi:MAG: family protease [Acidobacteria bacterium]|nr:family protease [Acidobacteriota bacterium]